jgi:sugar O-acyltransferase (sialic acid O-acetyltransferase NeuD family)
MKNISVLGCSSDTLTVIMDILQEIHGQCFFHIYLNIERDIDINFIHRSYKFSKYPIGVVPIIDDEVIFGLSGPGNKWRVYQYYYSNGGIVEKNYLNIIHPDTYIAPSTALANGILLEPGVIISSQATIGFGVSIKRGSLIGHHNMIGDFCDINPGVVISGKVNLGKGCTLGAGCMISDNVSIGDNSIIGIGSVVTKDIPADVIAYGNPCKVIRGNDLWKI